MNDSPKPKTALTGAILIDGTGKKPLEQAIVLVEGSRIATVGTAQTVAVPEDATVIDAAGRYLLPGLIDLHVHIYHPGFVPLPPKGGDAASYAGLVAMRNLRSALQAGITTVRDVCDWNHLDLAMQSAVQRKLILGPRLFTSGIGICMTGGHGSEMPGMMHEVDGPQAVRQAVRQEVKAGVDWIKLLSSHRTDNPEFSQEEISAGVDEAHRLGKKIAIHAANYVGVKMAAIAGVDTIEHGSFVDEEAADLMAEKGITLVPTLWVKNLIPEMIQKVRAKMGESGEADFLGEDMDQAYSWFCRCVEQLPKTIALARSKGVAIGTGTDSVFPDQPWAMLPEEMEWMTRYGIPTMDVICSATRVGAQVLGKAGELGTVEPGKLADLILVDRDPLADITAFKEVGWVMKEGAVVPRSIEWERRPVAAPGA